MKSFAYKPEIDGLRAIAVMAVVLYHAGFSLFKGGYVGVDVFFVISGYLITSLILREKAETGTFAFGRFYFRRIRRLFPALFATSAATAVGAFLFFSPERMEEFGTSALAALTSLSNIYFWFEADYFDSGSYTKPLLHTWSLSVEEQFYLIWPALTVFVLAKMPSRAAVPLIGILVVASLAFAEYVLVRDPDAAFYLLPARISEMALGAALAWVPEGRKTPGWMVEAGAGIGLALIAFAIVTFDHSTPFPGVSTLVPCVGTALIILTTRARFAGAVLRLKPFVWTGKLSYSLYLVHWPIVVFYLQLVEPEPTAVGKAIMVLLAFPLAWLQYEFVETRFRHARPGTDRRFAVGLGAATAAFASVAVMAWQSGGMVWRIPDDRVAKSNFEWRQLVRDEFCSSDAPQGTFAGDNPDLVTCQNYRGKDNDIYILGDSHALHLAAGFEKAFSAYNIHILFRNGCVYQSGFEGYLRGPKNEERQLCAERNRQAVAALEQISPTNIVLTSTKRSAPRHLVGPTKHIVERLKNAGHRVAVLADFIRPGRSLADCQQVPDYLLSDKDLANLCKPDSETVALELRWNRDFKRRLPELVEVNDIQCPDDNCQFYRRGKLLYRDDHHLNPEGARHFVWQIRDRLPIRKNGVADGPKTAQAD